MHIHKAFQNAGQVVMFDVHGGNDPPQGALTRGGTFREVLHDDSGQDTHDYAVSAGYEWQHSFAPAGFKEARSPTVSDRVDFLL